jgi:hypothetical protein
MRKRCFKADGHLCPAEVSEPVDRDIGQLFLQIFIHQLFVPVFRKVLAAGPAAEKDFFSGLLDEKIFAAVRAFFFNTHHKIIHESANFFK